MKLWPISDWLANRPVRNPNQSYGCRFTHTWNHQLVIQSSKEKLGWEEFRGRTYKKNIWIIYISISIQPWNPTSKFRTRKVCYPLVGAFSTSFQHGIYKSVSLCHKLTVTNHASILALLETTYYHKKPY